MVDGTMQRINDASGRIAGFIGVIDSIGFQTNILALVLKCLAGELAQTVPVFRLGSDVFLTGLVCYSGNTSLQTGESLAESGCRVSVRQPAPCPWHDTEELACQRTHLMQNRH